MKLRIVVEQVVDQVSDPDDEDVAGVYEVTFDNMDQMQDVSIHQFARVATSDFYDSTCLATLDDFNIYVVDKNNMRIAEYPFSKFYSSSKSWDEVRTHCRIDRIEFENPTDIKIAGRLELSISLDEAMAAVKDDVISIYEVPDNLKTVELCMLALIESTDGAFHAIPHHLLGEIVDAMIADENCDEHILQPLFRRMVSAKQFESAKRLAIQSPETLQWVTEKLLPNSAMNQDVIQMTQAMLREIELEQMNAKAQNTSQARQRL